LEYEAWVTLAKKHDPDADEEQLKKDFASIKGEDELVTFDEYKKGKRTME